MEFYTVEKVDEWYFKIKLPYADRVRCQYNQQILKYIYSIGRYVKSFETQYLYQEEIEDGVFLFQIGYASFILNEFINELDARSISILEDIIFFDHDIPEFANLRPDQNQDVRQLLTCKRGLFQTYTSYGKSEVIATLADYISNILKENVLIVTASGPALDEIKDRLYTKFNIDLDYFDPERNINALNLNGFLRSSYYDTEDPFWSQSFWILADEVEYCVSDTAMEFYENLHSIKCIYGFSATSDKKNAEPIYSRIPDNFLESNEITRLLNDPFNTFESRQKYCKLISDEKSKIRDILGRNKYLVGYFGNTVVFKKPNDFNITLIDVVTTVSKDDIEIPQEYDYNEIIYNLYTEDKICRLIESIAFKAGLIFIPMFRLQVIDYWLDNYFKKPGYIVLVISGRGYELFENGDYMCNINIHQMKRLVNRGIIDVILGTRSSYNSLDLPELNKSILLYSKAANIVIQAIGRTARGGEFEIYNIAPMKSIPTYSKDLIERKNLIKSYYSECNIIEIKRNENYYEY